MSSIYTNSARAEDEDYLSANSDSDTDVDHDTNSKKGVVYRSLVKNQNV